MYIGIELNEFPETRGEPVDPQPGVVVTRNSPLAALDCR